MDNGDDDYGDQRWWWWCRWWAAMMMMFTITTFTASWWLRRCWFFTTFIRILNFGGFSIVLREVSVFFFLNFWLKFIDSDISDLRTHLCYDDNSSRTWSSRTWHPRLLSIVSTARLQNYTTESTGFGHRSRLGFTFKERSSTSRQLLCRRPISLAFVIIIVYLRL